MLAVATTRVDVYRDYSPNPPGEDEPTGLDEWGNPINDLEDETETVPDVDPDAYLSNVPASIVEQTQKAPDISTGNLVPVRALVGRISGGTDIVDGDVLVDRKTGRRYRVTAWTEPQNPAIHLDRRLELTRTGG